MRLFKTTNLERRRLQLAFALLLRDRFAQSSSLLGKVTVRCVGRPEVAPFAPFLKSAEGAFLFFDLPAGNYTFQVRSDELTPYYLDTDIPDDGTQITLPIPGPVPPDPIWPAFPNLLLANRSIPLDDPAQPAAYRTQYLAASLRPTTAYPFPDGTTLARGRVLAGTAPLPGATVGLVNVPDLPGSRPRREKDQQYRTREDGEFVLFFPEVVGANETFTLRASHSARPDVDRNVEVRRGMTVATNIVMAP
jgi:hypothetical protein